MDSNVISRNGVYPVAEGEALPEGNTRANTRARWTGEVRCPRKGEWYLSGAVVESYRAPSDLSHSFHIARLVVGRMVWDQ